MTLFCNVTFGCVPHNTISVVQSHAGVVHRNDGGHNSVTQGPINTFGSPQKAKPTNISIHLYNNILKWTKIMGKNTYTHKKTPEKGILMFQEHGHLWSLVFTQVHLSTRICQLTWSVVSVGQIHADCWKGCEPWPVFKAHIYEFMLV